MGNLDVDEHDPASATSMPAMAPGPQLLALHDVDEDTWRAFVDLAMGAPIFTQVVSATLAGGLALWAMMQSTVWVYLALMATLFGGSRLMWLRQIRRFLVQTGIDPQHAAQVRKALRQHARTVHKTQDSRNAHLAHALAQTFAKADAQR